MTIQQSEIEEYNYASFQGGQSDFLAFRSLLPVGSAAPDFPVTDLDSGNTTQLSEHWRHSDLLVEFGSLT